MTEQEWLASEDPYRMVRWLTHVPQADPVALSVLGTVEVWCPPVPSDRKLRLFAVACCRLAWGRLTDARCRAVIEAAERYADDPSAHLGVLR